MIAATLALLVAAQPADPAPVDDDAILVLARRLETVAVAVSRDTKGRTTCSVAPSSGNPRIDSRLCETAARCVKKGAADNEAIKSCIDKRKPDLLREFTANLRRNRS